MASFFGTIGGVFVGLAIATGAPLGPIFALMNLQMIVLTVLLIFVGGIVPNAMQWAGLSLSLLAAMILTQHEKIIAIWRAFKECVSPNQSTRPSSPKS